MKKLMMAVAVLVMTVVTGSAQAAFTCEKIKDKATRASCIEDREAKAKADAEAQSQKKQDEKYQPFIAKAKHALTVDFKDPSTVQWYELFMGGKSTYPLLCGKVNAKNSYGGYIGFRRFIADDYESPLTRVEEEGDDPVFRELWTKHCSNRIYEIPAGG